MFSHRKTGFLLIMLFLTGIGQLWAQNSGIGTINPTHTLHIKPRESNPVQDPIRIEELKNYVAESDSMILVIDPDSGVVRVMHIDSLRLQSNQVDLVDDADANPTNEWQNASEVELSPLIDINQDNNDELTVQEALQALYDQLPKGTYKSISEARSAGLVDGDSFYAHPEGVLGCSGCIITLLPGMN